MSDTYINVGLVNVDTFVIIYEGKEMADFTIQVKLGPPTDHHPNRCQTYIFGEFLSCSL